MQKEEAVVSCKESAINILKRLEGDSKERTSTLVYGACMMVALNIIKEHHEELGEKGLLAIISVALTATSEILEAVNE